ncbi:hypothetical protein JTE90_000069 [Oedothorax gibbosus]|uniref:Uncharacterized protein n=1 Tax=Oedothorax gibbosus TaxID=931172 RepID=A0AAV6UDQ3_9ARAC|nr:hypothetical protein JTE90_000069 [Oedothorax gibbosus]
MQRKLARRIKRPALTLFPQQRAINKSSGDDTRPAALFVLVWMGRGGLLGEQLLCIKASLEQSEKMHLPDD